MNAPWPCQECTARANYGLLTCEHRCWARSIWPAATAFFEFLCGLVWGLSTVRVHLQVMQGMAGMDCNIGLRQCNCRGPVDLRALLPTWHAVPRQQSRRQHSSRHADSASLVASQQEPSRRRSVACAAASRRERLWDNVDGASTSAPLPSDPVTHEPWDVQRRGARPGVWDNGPVVDVEGLAINDSPNSSATAGQAAAATATAESQSPSVGNTAGAATGSSEASSAAASSGAAAADAAWPQVASSTDTWDEPGKAPNAWYEAGWGQPEPVYDWGADASTSAATGVPGQNGSSPGFEQQDQQGTGSRNWATHSRYEAGGMAGGGPYTEPPAGGAAGPADFFADAGQGGVGFDGSSMPSDITLLSRPDVVSTSGRRRLCFVSLPHIKAALLAAAR